MNSRKLVLFLGALLTAGCGGNVDLGGEPLTTPTAGAQLALGAEHGCAIVQGQVRCWGKNRNGEVGDGTMTERDAPVLVPGLEGVLEIASGAAFDVLSGTRGSHTCARLTDGTVACWGPNVDGQQDEGTIESRHLSPVPIAGLTGVVQIAAGWWNSCAVGGDGSLRCWGDNSVGQLGVGLSLPRSSTPVEVDGLADVVEVALGDEFTCARHANGTVSCWGSNYAGQLGDGTTTDRATPAVIAGLHDVAQISTAWDTVCARLGDGTVRCWGGDEVGDLGDDSNQDRSVPVMVAVQGVQQLSVGGLGVCTRIGTGDSCWGRDLTGDVTGDTLPHPVAGLTDVAEIVASPMWHACARLTDGQVECWGENESAQLGDGTTTWRSTPTPVLF